jgi:hypothetical protein
MRSDRERIIRETISNILGRRRSLGHPYHFITSLELRNRSKLHGCLDKEMRACGFIRLHSGRAAPGDGSYSTGRRRNHRIGKDTNESRAIVYIHYCRSYSQKQLDDFLTGKWIAAEERLRISLNNQGVEVGK